MTIGEKIYNLRKSVGLSQEEFGEILEVSRQSVSKWELDQTQPELKTALEISEKFGISLDSLLGSGFEEKAEKIFLDDILKTRLKFSLGMAVAFLGTVILSVYLLTLSKFGDPLKYIFYTTLTKNHTFSEIICFFVIAAIILGGIGISWFAIKGKRK